MLHNQETAMSILRAMEGNDIAAADIPMCVADLDSPTTTVINLSLATAALTAATNGTLTPLIKEELRYTIKNKRLSEGKSDIEMSSDDEDSSSSKYDKNRQLTPEEEARRKRRRERNKLAAQRCRNKKRERADELEKETEQLQARNSTLRSAIKELQEEREKLREMLESHKAFCIVMDKGAQPE